MNYIDLENGLSNDYKTAYKNAYTYAVMKNYSEGFINEKMTELYDILLSAQERGKPVNSIIGTDTDGFMRGYFSDFGVKERIIRVLNIGFRFSVIMLIITALSVLAADDPINELLHGAYDYKMAIGGLFTGFLITLITSKLFAPRVGKGKGSSGRFMGFTMVLFVVLVGAEVTVLDKLGGRLSGLKISELYTAIACGAYALIFLIGRAIWRYKNFGTIRNTKNMLFDEAYVNGLQNATLERTVMESWRKQAQKKLAKGKTPEEVRAWADLTYKTSVITNRVMVVCYVIIGVTVVIATARNSTLSDTFIFAMIILVMEVLLGGFFYKAFARSSAVMKAILTKCDESGKPLVQYLEDELADSDLEVRD